MFRFTIRDLLWLTVVVAVSIGWYLERRRVTPEDRQILKAAKALGFTVEIAKTGSPPPGPNAVSFPASATPSSTPKLPALT